MRYSPLPQHSHLSFIILLAVSIILHIGIISRINWNMTIQKPKERIFEVDLIKTEVVKRVPQKLKEIKTAPQPKKPKPPAISSISNKLEPDNKTQTGGNTHTRPGSNHLKKPVPVIQPVAKPKLEIDSAINQANLMESPVKTFDLNTNLPNAKSPETVITIKEANQPPISDIENVYKSEISPGKVKLEIHPIPVIRQDTTPYRIVTSPRREDTPKNTELVAKDKSNIEGEVSTRQVIFKPTPPNLNTERDVTIALRFTVLPTGEVNQILPFEKADAELERVAINLLQQYRFEPLFGSDVVQEGIIRFTIRRQD